MDGVVAGPADHQGLAPSARHFCRPRRLWPSRTVEDCEAADVMHRDAVRAVAEFAPVRQEPGDQLLVTDDARDQDAVRDDRVSLPSEGNASEPCDQWLPATAFDPSLRAL